MLQEYVKFLPVILTKRAELSENKNITQHFTTKKTTKTLRQKRTPQPLMQPTPPHKTQMMRTSAPSPANCQWENTSCVGLMVYRSITHLRVPFFCPFLNLKKNSFLQMQVCPLLAQYRQKMKRRDVLKSVQHTRPPKQCCKLH